MPSIVEKTAFHLLPTHIGSVFFKLTKKVFENDRESKLGNIWWYGYLYNFASHYDIEKIKKNNKGYRAVRTLMPNYDFFTSYNTVFHIDCISHILYELSQGYIPVIDDRFHVWSQFFEQPLTLDGKEIGNISDLQSSDEKSTLHTPRYIPFNKPVRKVWSKLLRDFSRLNEEAKNYIQNEIEDVLKDYRVLAVVCRGTDYIGTGMPAQPEVEDVIKEAKAWMSKYNYEKVYLATEDESIYSKFKNAFESQLLTNKRMYYDKAMNDQNVKWIGQVHFHRENDDYLKGLEYLSSIYILSNCHALLGGRCGASNLALLLNDEKYEHFKVYDL